MLFDIHVTEEDIRDGTKVDAFRCPIARAINRELVPLIPGAEFASVCSVSFSVSKVVDGVTETLFHCTDPPPSMFDFVLDYDGGRAVAPQVIQVEVPSHLLTIK